MSDQFAPPPGPPPSYHGQDTSDVVGGVGGQTNRQHVSFANQRSSSNELESSDPLHGAHLNAAQGQHPSNDELPPSYEALGVESMQWQDDKKAGPGEEYAPPPGAPPSNRAPAAGPPPYDPWMAVPMQDNAGLPPPPAIQDERSPTANASYDDAARGHAWCRANPLWAPRRHDQRTLSRIVSGDVQLTKPPNTTHLQVSHPRTGSTHVKTDAKCPDSIMLSDIPLYPATTGRPRTVYFELHVISMGGRSHGSGVDAGIAIGFVAPPYPAWRLPGWHRASLAVHGDDGRRYVDNSYGGQPFTSAFGRGDVVGIGMTFSPPNFVADKNRCEVFFTRNGRKEGGWDLHEVRDAAREEGEVLGLEGDHDLLAAVGCFGPVEFEVRFRRQDWLFGPPA